MESHNLKIVTFAETIRKQMQSHKQPLIRHRRLLPLFRNYPDVFYGCESVSWAMKSLSVTDKDAKGDSNSQRFLTENQACSLFQKLMDAGLLLNVTTQEEFKNDKSLFRFSSDDFDAEKLIRSVAIGYRIYDSAQSSETDLFQKVCSLGQLVSCECLKSSDIVTWLIANGLSLTRDAAVAISRDMVKSDILKPVDSDVQEFTDGKDFYMFAIDYKQPALTVDQFLNSSVVCPQEDSNQTVTSRNKHIHLRQTSDQLVDFSNLSVESPNKPNINRKKGISTSSDDSGFDDIALMTSPYTSYQSLLKSDGSMTKAALLHPSSPYKKKSLWILPDPVGYGFVIRGSGPCFVKIVDPDSPAGKAGLKANQYIICVNRNDVTGLHHTAIENMILSGPKCLKITVMQHKESIEDVSKPKDIVKSNTPPGMSVTPVRQRSCPPLPTAQPWIKKRGPDPYNGIRLASMRQVVSQ